MSTILYLRMFGYSITAAMHLGNVISMSNLLEGPAMEDPNVKQFMELHIRFFTVWTVIVQLFHAALGLACDYLTLKNAAKAEYRLSKALKGTKEAIFAAILWPTVFMTFTLFWSLYHYDRSLIYPLFADKILTKATNHILHTAIVPIALWEVCLQPRTVPKAHSGNITMLMVYMVTYLNILCYTYFEKGVWMYPVFGKAYKTIYFPLIIIIIGLKLLCFYHLQWYITRLIWGSRRVKRKEF